MKTGLLIVDFSNTLMRSLAVNSKLSFNNQSTGGFYGVVSQLVSRIIEGSPTHIVFCMDTKPYKRSEVYPEYKQNRKNKPHWYPSIPHNKEILLQFLDLCKIPVLSEVGLEADDLIAKLVKHYAPLFNYISILSNDDDLFQLLDYSNVTLLRSKTSVTKANFKDEYPGLDPQDWIYVTAMTGTHNNVSGIPGCGPKTALKWALQRKLGIFEEKVVKNKELIEQNIKLIQLPYGNDYTLSDFDLTVPHFPERPIMRYLYRYGVQYTKRMSDAFYQFNQNGNLSGFPI